MSEHEAYPQFMKHPHYQPARSEQVPGTGRYDARGALIPGTAAYRTVQNEKFPPVLVMNEQQQDLHAAQGYEPAGRSDPKAFAAAVATPIPPNYQAERYPMLVGDKLVNDEAEEAAARSLSPVVAAEPETPPATSLAPQIAAPDDRDAVIAALQAQLAVALAAINQLAKPKDARPARRPSKSVGGKVDKRTKAYKAQQSAAAP